MLLLLVLAAKAYVSHRCFSTEEQLSEARKPYSVKWSKEYGWELGTQDINL